MFFKLFGLSIIVHFTIIIGAKIVNLFRRTPLDSAFQTYGKGGGIVRSKYANMALSFAILAIVVSYTLLLLYVAINTSLKIGATEPQVIFMKAEFATIAAFLLAFFSSTVGVLVVAIALSTFLTYHLILRRRLELKHALLMGDSTPAVLSTVSAAAVVAFVARIGLGAMIGAALFSIPLWAGAQIVEPGFQSTVVASGFSLPTATAYTPDGRIFVAEKNGIVKVIKNGALLPTPLITLTDVNTFGDRGLIGMAVDPQFAQNGYLYLSYTYENTPGFNVAGPKTVRIVRVTVVGDTASESSKLVLVGTVGGNSATPSCEDYAVTDDCIASDSNSHSGGALAFGPDGKLYASTGDGADFNSVDARALRAQNIDSLAGKVLRINTDGTAPSDNPFYNGDPNSNRSKVYAFGFRNQFRLAFNPTTGKLYGGDVGWSNWEEVNQVQAGKNYGWPCYEGDNPQPQYACTPSSPVTAPLYTYPHDGNGAGSITLGAFPSNNAYPSQYNNTLFVGDYAQQWIKQVNLDATGNLLSVTDFETGGIFPVELQRGTDGNVYYIDIAFGTLNKLTHTTGNRTPVVTQSANTTSGLTPLTVAFSSAGSYDPDGDAIGYAWNFGDGTFAATANPTHTYTTNGKYNVTLVVSDVYGASAAKTMTITAGNQKPTATITSPADGTFYRTGDNLMVMADATDPEDGTLPASAFSWDVILHHNIHTHPFQQFTGTKMINVVPDDHNASDVYLEVILTVTDSAGLTDTTSINLYYNNAPTGLTNLISNPSVETPDPALSYQPKDWYNGWFGSMDTTYTYPAQGISGNNAIKVDVANYVSGTSKWFFSPVFVEGGKTYTFSDVYLATVQNYITARYERADGSAFYQTIATLPATTDPTTVVYDIDVPADAVNMTIYHELASNGSLTTDEYVLMKQATTTDTNPPTGYFTNINDGDTVSGTVPLDIYATDAEGPVVKVHLYVDGSKDPNYEDTTVPFQILWDTTAYTNGPHTIQVHMHDQVDNHGLSAPITVTINNTGTSTGTSTATNLIQNGNFETAGPIGWAANSWGNHTANHAIVAGRNGGSAAQTNITAYPVTGDGDSKWVHADVAVTPGESYTYEDWYTANTISDIIGRYTYSDGHVSYFGLIKEIPPATTWTHLIQTFTPPAGAVSVTFFHLISSVGSVTIDDVALYDNNATTTPSEANAPDVSWYNPHNGDVLSGTVTFMTDASDDTAVAGVYYAIDGVPFGAEQTVFPYALDWDTTTYPNGTYLLKTTAHDVFGNNDKALITVTVNNTAGTTTPPTGTSTNRIANGAMETVGTNGDPKDWSRGGWGTNTRTFTYPVAGVSGNAARVEMTSYTSGDAKWYFKDVAVTGGETIPYTESYRSNIASGLTARFTDATGAVSYQYILTLPASPTTWSTLGYDIVVPASAVSMTMFHTISGVGWLETDSFTLGGSGTTNPTDTTAPTVNQLTLTNGQAVSGTVAVDVTATDDVAIAKVELFVNGVEMYTDLNPAYTMLWNTYNSSNGTTTVFVRATDTSGNTAETPVITVRVQNNTNNLVANPELETVGTNGDPQDWYRGGWGTNTRTFTYPIVGNSNKGARVEITNYTSGDAKWYFKDVPVIGGEDLPFQHSYRSNVPTELVARFTDATGGVSYQYIAAPPVSTTWVSGGTNIRVPANAVSMTVFHTIAAVGYLEIDSFAVGTTSPIIPTDTTKPNVTLVSPTDGQVLSGTVTVSIVADDPESGIGQTNFILDGNVVFDAKDTTAPYDYVWDTTQVANGTHTIQAFANNNVLLSNLTPVITVTVNNSGATTTPPTDTTAPTIQTVSGPADGTTVIGTATIDVTATDNVAVAQVELLVNNGVVATDTTAPYSLNWDTTATTDGSATYAVRVSDTSGNSSTTPATTVTVQNNNGGGSGGGGGTGTTTPPTTGNLIINGDLELADSTNPNHPNSWSVSNFGSYDSTFTYPIAGKSGNAARIDIANYVSGDAKWTFDPVTVTPGNLYTFEFSYRSDVGTDLTVQYKRASGGYYYVGLAKLPASPSWTTMSEAIVVPSDAVAMSIFNSMVGNGFLEIDELSLTDGTPYAFNNGIVSLTFDDGWLTHYTEALPALEKANLDATFYVVSEYTGPAAGAELVANNDIVSTGGAPTDWFQGGWGSSTRSYSYSADAVTVTVSNYTDGDAKWYFKDVPVTAGKSYVIGDTYSSDVASEVVLRYTFGDGSVQYGSLGTLASTNNKWKVYSNTVVAPANAVSMTVFHVIFNNGSLSLERATVVPSENYISVDETRRIQAAGHEIAAHTKTHRYLSTLSQAEQVDELSGSKTAIENTIVPSTNVTSIAYPFGDYDTSVINNTIGAGYTAARSVNRGYNTKDTYKYALKIQQVDRTTTMSDINKWIAEAERDNTWLILMFHQVDAIQTNTLGVTPAFLDQILTAVKNSSLDVETVESVLPQLN